MTLHLSQIFLTDALTFISASFASSLQLKVSLWMRLLEAIYDAPARQVIRGKFDKDFIPRQNLDKVLSHTA